MESRDGSLKKIEEGLASLFGPEGYPRPLVGDLDDLLCTLEQASRLLQSLSGEGAPAEPEELRAQFVRLGILLDQDLPMILEDVAPAMRQLLPETLGTAQEEA